MSWQVYLLRCGDNTLYCGVTVDIERRLAQHNGLAPGGARYTRGRRPVELLACVDCRDRANAQRLEARVKSRPAKQKLPCLLAGI